MSKRSLGVLLAIFLILCGLVFWVQWRAKPIQPQGPFPGDSILTADINRTAAFTISSAAATTRVARKEGRWVVESRYGYPADFNRIVEQLRALAELKVGQVIRAEEADMAEFGLGPEQATTIRLEDEGGQVVAELKLGNPRQARREGGMIGVPEGVYMRVGDGPVLVVDAPMSMTFGWTDTWLERDIVNVPADSVASVMVESEDGSYTLRIPKAGEYEMDGLAENEKIESFAASRLARALSPLTLLDVADPEAGEDTGLDEPTRLIMATREGERYTVEVGRPRSTGGGRYVRLKAAYERPAAPESFEGVEPESEEFRKKVEEFEKDCAERERKVAEQQALFEKWVYVVADYHAENLTLKRGELVRIEQPSQEQDAAFSAAEGSELEEHHEAAETSTEAEGQPVIQQEEQATIPSDEPSNPDEETEGPPTAEP